MDGATIASILSGIGTFLGALGGILISNRLTNYRIEQLEKKVDAHNSIVTRMYVQEEKQKVNEHRIKNLEEAVK